MKITGPNFLHWYDTQIDPRLPEVPYAYHVDRTKCDTTIIGVPTEAMSFYINTVGGLSFEDFDDLGLALIRSGSDEIVGLDLGPLKQVDINGFFYDIYCALIIPISARVGIHYFRIYRKSTGEILLRSSSFLVRVDTDQLLQTTSYARFRHDRYFFGMRYTKIPAFYQQFRLGISKIDEPGEVIKDTYFATSTGRPVSSRAQINRLVRMETYYFSPSEHEAALIMFEHKHLELNGRQYSSKTGYKYAPEAGTKFNKGEVELYDIEFSKLDRC